MKSSRESSLETARKAVDEALKEGADQAEASILSKDYYLTRFANSIIHQNVGETDMSLSLRFVSGKKISSVSTNDTSDAKISELAKKARQLVAFMPEDPEFVSLPDPEPVPELPDIFVRGTADCEAKTRAEMAKALIDSAHGLSQTVESVAGAFLTSTLQLAVVNSLGIESHALGTIASINTNVIVSDGTSKGYGYAADMSKDVRDLRPDTLGKEAAERASKSLRPVRLEPADYTSIFEPYAVSTALAYFAYQTRAQPFQDGTSFMCDVMGKHVLDDGVTIWDDGLDLRGVAFPLDPEGVPKRKVVLVEGGTPRSVVYDSYTAHKEGKKSTGHLGGCANLFMGPGDSSLEEMIEETRKGVLVTRWHYVRTVHPRKAIVTGMTRDGTWLVEDGEVKSPVMNLRFTESFLRMLSNVPMISRDTRRTGSFIYAPSCTVAPAIKVEEFRFTGVTEY